MGLHFLIFAFLAFTTTVFYVGGVIEEDEDANPPPPFMIMSTETTAPDLPLKWDWRSVGGVSYLSQVENQGRCGSCVAFAAVSAVEASLNIACKTPDRSFDLSRQFVFSCGGGSCDGGWRLSDASEFISQQGIPDTACLPYGSFSGGDVECSEACPDLSTRLIKNISYTEPTTGFIDVVAIKRAVLKSPVMTRMILYTDLLDYTGGIYRHTYGTKDGGHAVVIVGWEDDSKVWIVRNSWGPYWGDRGYFKIPWDDPTLIGRYTYLFDVTSAVSEGICYFPR